MASELSLLRKETENLFERAKKISHCFFAQRSTSKNAVDLINKLRAVSCDASRNADRADLLILEASPNVFENYKIGFEIHQYDRWIDSILQNLESALLRWKKLEKKA